MPWRISVRHRHHYHVSPTLTTIVDIIVTVMARIIVGIVYQGHSCYIGTRHKAFWHSALRLVVDQDTTGTLQTHNFKPILSLVSVGLRAAIIYMN